jgi:hypothetical protein
MNNRQKYLAWLRTTAPTVYAVALRKATGQGRTLGGLADDLVKQAFAPDIAHSFLGDDTSSLDPITVTASSDSSPLTDVYATGDFLPVVNTPTFDASLVQAPSAVAIDTGTSTVAPSAPAASSSTFANILTAVAAIGAGVVSATNQSKLIALNTTRAAQGLPPVNAAGQVVSTTGFATTSPSLLAFERSISGAGGVSLLPILAILGIGAYFVFKGRSA